MFGYRGFQEILRLLLAQIAVITIFLALAGMLFSTAIAEGDFRSYLSFSGSVLALAALLFVLRLTWPVAMEPVELLWGTSAKVRITRWLEPALLWAALAVAVASIFALLGQTAGLFGTLAFAIVVLAALVPLGVSLALLVSALRKKVSYQKGIDIMNATLGDEKGFERVIASVKNEAGTIETTVKANPQGFAFAGLTSKPWHDPKDFPWIAAFEDAVDEIASEAERVLRLEGDRIQKYDYVGLDGDFWKSFKFVARHKPNEDNLASCPTTAALLRTVPGFPIFRDAMFSILEGGGIIRPHRDVSNVFLTLHLPLVAPKNGTIEVGGLKRSWERGKALVFDSSYSHQAVNASDQTRVILLVDFLHPDLTEQEREWVKEMSL
jgi:beta-hydroxylase